MGKKIERALTREAWRSVSQGRRERTAERARACCWAGSDLGRAGRAGWAAGLVSTGFPLFLLISLFLILFPKGVLKQKQLK